MLNSLMAFLTVRYEELKNSEDGQGLIEYALIAVLISIVAIVLMNAVGLRIDAIFGEIQAALNL